MSTPKLEPLPRRVRKTILVVEDEKLVRWSIREALRRDYRVRLAESAEDALRMMAGLKTLDAVLADIRLPGMSGLDFCRQARASWPKAKIFVMTAYDHQTAPRNAFGVQADGYLAKPFPLETLKDMLTSHLGSSPA